MKKVINIIIIFLFTCFILESCTSTDSEPTMDEDSYLVLSNVNDEIWTYISLSTGTIVGTSEFGSIKEDEEWKNRTDWDIAICGKYVRTNSGTSGNGQGGLIKVEGMSYESITEKLFICPSPTFPTAILRTIRKNLGFLKDSKSFSLSVKFIATSIVLKVSEVPSPHI